MRDRAGGRSGAGSGGSVGSDGSVGDEERDVGVGSCDGAVVTCFFTDDEGDGAGRT